jgi:hypothetical protein
LGIPENRIELSIGKVGMSLIRTFCSRVGAVGIAAFLLFCPSEVGAQQLRIGPTDIGGVVTARPEILLKIPRAPGLLARNST